MKVRFILERTSKIVSSFAKILVSISIISLLFVPVSYMTDVDITGRSLTSFLLSSRRKPVMMIP